MHLRKRNSYCLSSAVLWFSFAAMPCNAFTTAPATAFVASHRITVSSSFATSLKAATAGGGGFGGSAGSKDKPSSTTTTSLKPKQQWDRYLAMGKPKDGETVTTVNVAVRREADGEWFTVGAVRSASDVNIAAAVARQRSLIADHARRLHPLQISKQDKVEWGYSPQQNNVSTDGASWSVVDTKTIAMESGLEKKIGFQGQEDPASGYYCLYNGGRRVTGDSGAAEGKGPKPQSKKRDRDVN
ncbi:hypothetical protein MPSEU_000165300 [Mayamaea pseudoterrestris]|nr:hypothetical protein MPSEU_000165300 [Mayamaea pseudoterrestris]